jgi:hypothetical protein
MKYIEYLNLPTIPENLIESVQDIINKPSKTSTLPTDYPFFKTRYVNQDLEFWLQSHFEFKINPQYQLIYNGLPIHVDKGNRIIAYNYLLDAGGDNVKTAIYDEKYKPLQVETLELKRWHRINTGMLHGVHGIDSDKIRVSISVAQSLVRAL